MMAYNPLWYGKTWRTLSNIRGSMGLTAKEFPVEGKGVVDIGCGEGRVSIDAEKENAKFYVGLDTDGTQLKCWWGKDSEHSKEKAGVVHMDGSGGLPIKDAAADVVICSFVFPYVEDKLSLLGEIVRILALGGRTYFLDSYVDREDEKAIKLIYTSIDHAQINTFWFVDRKYKSQLEDLKTILKTRQLNNGAWRKESSLEAKDFGRLLDSRLLRTEEDRLKFKIGDMTLEAINFNTLFSRLLKKCDKLNFTLHGGGMILEKIKPFSGKDVSKIHDHLKNVKTKYHLLNLKFDKQHMPAYIVTVFDSRMLG